MIYVQDKRLLLPDGRTLAYADNGNTSSLTVILFLHGPFSVGDASRLSLVLQSKKVHLVCPSLPGWGFHLHPDSSNLKLFICSHSFGSIAAQILYAAPYASFPYGPCIAGMILLDALSPPHCHKNYWEFLSWQSYFLTGPPSRLVPFNFLAVLAKFAIESKLRSEAGAESFVRSTILPTSAEEDETEEIIQWREDNDIEEGQYEREIARNAIYSVASTWQGFLEIPQIYHSGWGGFRPDLLDEEHSRPPVTIITSNGDRGHALAGMGSWLVRKYRNATLRMVEGRSALSLLMCLDDVWKEILS
ncbi:hypothetical protein BT96DRAFT_961769 [Gymnopus androsaceus JB14]|uniref:AB hydrolase-1 domain-containing protein n=1 Tax=Gymnopus androsaceus JB14 TaxID=1447944 RepID=A0A6A4IK41_9AGAR|nr:hypothetical protein BT96DRAFT_961769 [Gymnopus androsaceus JB14]